MCNGKTETAEETFVSQRPTDIFHHYDHLCGVSAAFPVRFTAQSQGLMGKHRGPLLSAALPVNTPEGLPGNRTRVSMR